MSHGRDLAHRMRASLGAGILALSFTSFAVAQEESAPTAATNVSLEAPYQEFPTADLPAVEAPFAVEGCVEEKPFWTKVPPLSPNPRTGPFVIFPSGPGYYSLADVIRNNYRETAPKTPWPPIALVFFPFFEGDFRYLDDPNNTQHDWLDPLKRIHIGDNWLLSLGGEFRYQLKDEYDSRLTGVNNNYSLMRTRLYGDLWYRDRFRVYAEFIDAQSSPQSLPPQPIDRNFGDILNLFVDLKLFDIQDKGVYVRGGRQELCYGSQRLVSPLDWANTQRTFEGIKGYWRSEKWDVDAFCVKPVLVQVNRFDFADSSRPFAGVWNTFRPKKSQAIDLYYLYLDQDSKIPGPSIPGTRGGQNINTVGGRYVGDRDGSLLWDFEGMYQFGTTVGNQSISAGAATAGVGYRLKDRPMTPTFWVYNDWASGDKSGGQGGTFNQLFPFGHFYFGFLDEVGRQNIEDLNLHFNLFPTNWILTGLQAHFFYLDSRFDALYNASGTPIRKSADGSAGYHVGDEIDWITNFHLTTHQDILLGFSQLFAGEFIRNTGSPKSPQLFYMQYSYKW
jgi:hypothetical protein